MDDVIDFLGGFLLGAAVAGAVGLLLAPQSGADLQRSLRERANLMVEEGRRAAADRRAELEAQFAQSKQITRSA
jgi:gas vesicle protein